MPAVRRADTETLVVDNGFSCQTQIEQGGTGRRALHLAEVRKLAREHGPHGPAESDPEGALGDARPRPGAARRAFRIGLPVAAATLGAAALASRFPASGRRVGDRGCGASS